MADISDLLSMSPGTGAYFLGQNQASNDITTQLKQKQLVDQIMAAQVASQQQQAMNPLLLEKQKIANSQANAELPGIIATSNLNQTKANNAAATASSDIDATNASNKMKLYTTVGSHLGSISGAIDSNPNVPPHMVFANEVQKLGLPDNITKGILDRYSQVPASQLSQKLKSDGSYMLKETPGYSQAMDVANTEANSRRDVANIQANAQRDVEQKRIDAGKYSSQRLKLDVNQALLRARSAAQAAEIYSQAANATEDPEEQQKYTLLAQQARQRAAEDASNRPAGVPKVDVQSYGVPVTPPPQAGAPVGVPGGQPTPQPSNPLTPSTPIGQAAPPGAIQMLRNNPGLAAQFDAKYGPGASKRALGQ